MNAETLNNIDKVNEVGKEPKIGSDSTDNRKEIQGKRKKNAMTRYRNWLFGLAISLIPLLAVPFIHLFLGESSLGEVLYKTFCSYEIIFVGISLSIAAVNDFIAQETEESKESKEGWTWINIIIILFGAVIYGALAYISSKEQGLVLSVVFKFNLIYLGIILALGSAKYFKEFREVK